MIEYKLFEIRDIGTCISALALRFDPDSFEQRNKWITGRAGFRNSVYTLVINLKSNLEIKYDCYSWNSRTMHQAHGYIERNWPDLNSGDIIDVQYLLGETKEPKKTDQLYQE